MTLNRCLDDLRFRGVSFPLTKVLYLIIGKLLCPISIVSILGSEKGVKLELLYYTRIFRFAGFISAMLLWGKVEKTNKSELWNRLTYRVLIYIFEVGMKTFFLNWEISRSKSQFKKNKKIKNGLIFIFWGWRLIFFGFKTFPPMSLNSCKSRISWISW